MYTLDAGAADIYGWKKHVFSATAVVLVCKILFMSQWQFWRISVLAPWSVLGRACSCRAGSAGEGVSFPYSHCLLLCTAQTPLWQVPLKTPRDAESGGFALLYLVSSLRDMETVLPPVTQTPETAKVRSPNFEDWSYEKLISLPCGTVSSLYCNFPVQRKYLQVSSLFFFPPLSA